MTPHENKTERGRPPPRVSWRRLARTDAGGLTLIGLFFGTLLTLSVFFLLGN